MIRQVLASSFSKSLPAPAITRRVAVPYLASVTRQRLFATTPDSATVAKARDLFNEGTNRWNKNDLNGARDAFQESTKLHATSDNFYNLGNSLYSLGKNEEAVSAWQQCIAIEPNQLDAHVNLANVYALHLKNVEKAMEHYQIAVDINPVDGEVQYNYGVVLDSVGRLEDAIEMYEAALANGIKQAETNLKNATARWLGKQIEASKKDA
ncbi:hypothetical protein BC830DRAFT_1172347 [Chytriomyces sp. MP71]|nr:hypothetical protein BC830DRAFT_1172347 [Chytriomyces sp. MP71]